jgi:hypothetical protein
MRGVRGQPVSLGSCRRSSNLSSRAQALPPTECEGGADALGETPLLGVALGFLGGPELGAAALTPSLGGFGAAAFAHAFPRREHLLAERVPAAIADLHAHPGHGHSETEK